MPDTPDRSPGARLLLALCGTSLASFLGVKPAFADYARPPESPHELPGEEPRPLARCCEVGRDAEPSTFRFQVGPAFLLQPAQPGLSAALDIGRQAVGGRLSGTWLRAGSERGLSSYSAELCVDFRHRHELHPILGAGAAWLHGGALDHRSVGAGVLRGALEYELPIVGAEARVGLQVTALIPAIEARHGAAPDEHQTERTRPWVVTALMLGAGF